MTQRTPKKPYIPRDLLEWLKARFPDSAPLRTDTDREVWIRVGHVEVVRHLQALYDQQETT